MSTLLSLILLFLAPQQSLVIAKHAPTQLLEAGQIYNILDIDVNPTSRGVRFNLDNSTWTLDSCVAEAWVSADYGNGNIITANYIPCVSSPAHTPNLQAFFKSWHFINGDYVRPIHVWLTLKINESFTSPVLFSTEF